MIAVSLREHQICSLPLLRLSLKRNNYLSKHSTITTAMALGPQEAQPVFTVKPPLTGLRNPRHRTLGLRLYLQAFSFLPLSRLASHSPRPRVCFVWGSQSCPDGLKT